MKAWLFSHLLHHHYHLLAKFLVPKPNVHSIVTPSSRETEDERNIQWRYPSGHRGNTPEDMLT